MHNPIRDPEITHALAKLRANGDHAAAQIVEGVFRKNREMSEQLGHIRGHLAEINRKLRQSGR